jgi:hypothetical protein
MRYLLILFLVLPCSAMPPIRAVQCHARWYYPNNTSTFTLLQGNKSGNYNTSYNVGTVHVYGLMLTPGKTYYFVVYANPNGIYSKEVKFTVPLVSPKFSDITTY